MLQERRRKAQLNPHDVDTLWDYINLLERSCGGVKDISLYAVLTDGETCGSPCKFSSGTAVPYQEGDSKITLYGRWMDDYSDDDPEYYFPGIDRAWIITETTKKAGEAVWRDSCCGNDSTGDAVTSAMLSIYKNLSIKTIEFPPDPRCQLDEDGSYFTLSEELRAEIHAAYQTYRRTKDGGKVRTSFWQAYDTMDMLLGSHVFRVFEGGGEEKTETQSLPYPPRQLLVQPLYTQGPFKAILHKESYEQNSRKGFRYYLLCESCSRKNFQYRCSKKPDEKYAHSTHHRLDEHLLLEIDGTPIANEDEFSEWLDGNAYQHLDS